MINTLWGCDNMNRNICKAIAFGLATMSVMSAVGCGSNEYLSIPIVDSPTQYELYERFKDNISSDAYTIRGGAYVYENVVYIGTPSYIKDDVDARLAEIEDALAKDYYDESMADLITENEFNYIKCQMDDRVYERQSVDFEGYSSGVAVVDVTYKGTIKKQSIKSDYAKYFGVNGVFIKDDKDNGNVIRDDTYILRINREILKHFTDTDEEEISEMTEDDISGLAFEFVNKNTEGQNVKLYNQVVGSSMSQIAAMPDIRELVTPESNNGKLGGYGIYTQGGDIALCTGDPDYVNKQVSTMTIRYVFSVNELKNTCELQKLYVKNYALDLNIPFDNTVVSEAVNQEINIMLDRADKAILNGDLGALASQEIYYNNRCGIYWGLYNDCTYITKRSTSVSDYVGRETMDGVNKYFIIANTYTSERVKGDGEQTAVYNDVYWLLLTLSGETEEFVISDYVLVSRELIKEPENEYEDEYRGIIQALSVDSEISNEDKQSIRTILDEYETLTENRDFDTIKNNVNTISGVMTQYDLEKYIGQVQDNANARGKSKTIDVSNAVVNYITGNAVQMEVIVDELIDYGDGYGMYSSIYIMFRKEDNEWKITEIRYIDSERLSDSNMVSQRKSEKDRYKGV